MAINRANAITGNKLRVRLATPNDLRGFVGFLHGSGTGDAPGTVALGSGERIASRTSVILFNGVHFTFSGRHAKSERETRFC